MTLQTQLKIDPTSYKAQISLDVKVLSICMLKKQLQNIVRLIELNDDYNNIQDCF
jgi:hypothetical protein